MSKYSTPLYNLIQSVANSFDDCILGARTATSTTGTVVCNTLLKPNDHYNGWDLHFYQGTHVDTTREVTDWDLSTYTLSFLPIVTGEVDDTDYFQLHKLFKYSQYKDAVNRAIQMGKFEYLLNKKDDTAMMNRLTNWDFESATTGWTISGSGASGAISTSQVAHGAYSYALTVAGADAYAYQTISNPGNYRGKHMTFKCWVYSATASKAYISVNDGITEHVSDYHGGGSEWEELIVDFNVDDEPTTLQARICGLAGAATYYFEMPVLVEDNCYELSIPSGFQRISEIWYESIPESTDFDTKMDDSDWWIVKDGTTPLIRFAELYSSKTGFRIIGQATQSALTADADYCYLPPEAIIQMARGILCLARIDYKDQAGSCFSFANKIITDEAIPVPPGTKSVYEL